MKRAWLTSSAPFLSNDFSYTLKFEGSEATQLATFWFNRSDKISNSPWWGFSHPMILIIVKDGQFYRIFWMKGSQKVTLPTLKTLLYIYCKNPWEFPRFPGYVDQQSLVKLTNHYPIHQWRLYLIAWFNWYLVTDYFRHEETEFVSTSHLYLSEWNFLEPIML